MNIQSIAVTVGLNCLRAATMPAAVSLQQMTGIHVATTLRKQGQPATLHTHPVCRLRDRVSDVAFFIKREHGMLVFAKRNDCSLT